MSKKQHLFIQKVIYKQLLKCGLFCTDMLNWQVHLSSRLMLLRSKDAPLSLQKVYTGFIERVFYGDVVASWMTKEDRLNDIQDYVAYLNKIVETFTQPGQNITLFGFSQGVATACRWLADGNIQPNQLVLWAGTFPQDIDLKRTSKKMESMRCYLAFDESDPFRNEASWQKQLSFIDKIGVNPVQFRFDGGHSVPTEALSAFTKQYF